MDPAAETIKALSSAIFRERVLRARTIPPERRIGEALELYECALKFMMSGIHHQHGRDPDVVAREVRRRTRVANWVADRNLFQPVETSE